MKPESGKFVPATGLTTEDLAPFIDGQVEVNSFSSRYVYVGEIDRAVVEGNQIRIGLSLVLNGERHPPFPKRWIRDDKRNSYIIDDLSKYTVADIGPGKEGGGCKWFLHSRTKSEFAILYPADGRKFDARAVSLLTPVGEFSSGNGISVD